MSRKVLCVSSLSSRFQTTVPKLVREILKIEYKDRVVWILDNGEIKVRNGETKIKKA